MDTGSSLTAFPCSGCEDCGAPRYHIDGYFTFEDSSTFERTECGACQRGTCSTVTGVEQCKISMSYQEGSSWYAFEAKDTTYVGGPHTSALLEDSGTNEDIDPLHAKHFAFPMVFGCQYKLTGLFKTQLADGIMGMENANTSFWKQMYESGKMGNEQKFSLCFSRPVEASKDGTEAGAMTFGGVEKRLHKTDMVYTSKGKGRSGFFGVKLRKMYLRHGEGGVSAKSSSAGAKVIELGLDETSYNKGGIIVDSGTTDTYFVKYITAAFEEAFLELTGTKYGHSAMTITDKELNSYPTILFQLYGDETLNKEIGANPRLVAGLAGELDPENPYDVILAMPPSHYMELDNNGKYVARFYTTEGSGSVLGANAMMGHDVMFDADNLNIGWAESDCDYNKLVTDGGFTDVLNDGSSRTSIATLPPASGGDDAKKKSHPDNTENAHDNESPVDDIKKAMNGWADDCDTLFCRGGVAIAVLLSLVVGCCCAKLCCGCGSPKTRGYKHAELELADAAFRDDGAYMDDPDDAEYGEFETNKRIS